MKSTLKGIVVLTPTKYQELEQQGKIDNSTLYVSSKYINVNDIPKAKSLEAPQIKVVNSLNSSSITSALAANQGRILNDKLNEVINKIGGVEPIATMKAPIVEEEPITNNINLDFLGKTKTIDIVNKLVNDGEKTELANLELEKGSWIINANVSFPKNKNGYRVLSIGNNSSSQQACSDYNTDLDCTKILVCNETNFLKIYAQQNSMSDLIINGSVSAIRIK